MSQFPDSSTKAGGPSKKSIFERQKAEAEAKRVKEQAETAAVLEDFVKSFEDDGSRVPSMPTRGAPSGPGKRHFTSSGLKSGPGSLGPGPGARSGSGSLGPAPNRKRHYDEYSDRRGEREGMFSYNDERKASVLEDRDEEKAAAKPTIHLSSLPPGTSTSVIKALFTSSPLTVENIRILPPSAPTGPNTERKSMSAIVELAADTPGADIDAVVSRLQNRYMGWGFNLGISRHLSSAALTSTTLSVPSSHSLPFGAKAAQQHSSLSRAPPPGQRFAPPISYTSTMPYGRGSTSIVAVQPPSDLKQIKLIHKMLEALLTYGPEFEALLMSRPQVQNDEQWSWLWNSRSAGGVYYRWRLWEILTDARRRRKHGRYAPETLFEGQSVWQPPEESLRFEYMTNIDEFVSDEDYNSSDEEEDAGGIASRYTDHRGPAPTIDDNGEGVGYLNPLARSKLVHLLSRLPDSNTRLRKGDVARITAFAIDHAGAGAGEVTSLITQNVVRPFANTEDDSTAASLVGLFVISDILSSSASAGVRHAWRYRTLFENAFRQQKVFEKLGRAEKDFAWGKLKAEKWKRSIQSLFSLWEGWSVFPQASHEEFTERFMNPPLSEKEKSIAEAEERRKVEEEAKRVKTNNKWRSVDDEAAAQGDVEMSGVDGTAMDDDSDMEDVVDGDIDGVPMEDSSDEEIPVPSNEPQPIPVKAEPERQTLKTELSGGPPGRRQRPRAADMFADDSS